MKAARCLVNVSIRRAVSRCYQKLVRLSVELGAANRLLIETVSGVAILSSDLVPDVEPSAEPGPEGVDTETRSPTV